MKTTIILIIALASLLFAQTYTASDYFPLGVGYIWNYIDSNSTADTVSISTTEITGDTTMDGYPAYIVETTGDSNYTSYYEIRDDGIYYLIMGAFWGKVLPTEFSFGDVWDVVTIDTTGTDSSTGYDYQMHSYIYATVESIVNVNVPAGEFENCIKIVMTNEMDVTILVGGVPMYSFSDTFDQFENWYAYGVGVVQSIERDPNPMSPSETYSYLREYDLTKVAETKGIPQTLAINAYPNPFNSSCEIDVPQGTRNVRITDLSGKIVADIPISDTKAIWKPTMQNSSGIYFIDAIKDGQSIAEHRIFYLK